MIVATLRGASSCPYGPTESGGNIAEDCWLWEPLPPEQPRTSGGYDISSGQALNPGDVLRVPDAVSTLWPWVLGGLVLLGGGAVAYKVVKRRRRRKG